LIQPLGDEVIAAWEAFNRYSKKYFESKKEDHRLQALTKVVAEIKQALSSAQRKVKAPVTDYGLQYLIEEMTSGQEAYFALFCEGQKRYRNAIKIIYQFAEEEMASESDEDSQASSSTSSSSFFSESGRKRARSLASTETSSSDALSSDSSEETEEEESEMSLAR